MLNALPWSAIGQVLNWAKRAVILLLGLSFFPASANAATYTYYDFYVGSRSEAQSLCTTKSLDVWNQHFPSQYSPNMYWCQFSVVSPHVHVDYFSVSSWIYSGGWHQWRYFFPVQPCPPGQTFEPPAPGSCKSKYRIEIVPEHTDVTGRGEVEPGGSLGLRAVVYDQSGQVVAGITVNLKNEVQPNSGGHQHHDGRDNHKGSVPQQGQTGADGFAFAFTAPIAAGDHTITASCNDCENEDTYPVWVGVKGLVPIPPIPTSMPKATYELYERDGSPVGWEKIHPSNHYLTPEAVTKLWNLGFWYSSWYPEASKLHINDASLPYGGVFDLKANWGPKHHEHRRGTVVDIRANGSFGSIPVSEEHFGDFEYIAARLRVDARVHNPNTNLQHYHVRLAGVKE